MTRSSLDRFINVLEKENDLIRVKTLVNPELEITEITNRIIKSSTNGGKALLFENNGTSFPVVINLFGSLNRMIKILNVNNLDDVGVEISELFQILVNPEKKISDKIRLIPFFTKLSGWLPKKIKGKGACQEIIHRNPDLGILPVLKCWPYDGGRFITLPLVITKDPETGIRNVGMYRMQILSKNETAIHWQKYKTGRKHFEKYRNLCRKMPVAVALGGDPIYTYTATAPLPEGVDEFILAGFLRKDKVKLVKCITQDIEVPADADIIIEGYIDPDDDLVWEGPFGDHTGYYSLADWFPKFNVTCISHKRNAIYPATIVGQPPMEDAWLAKATERIFLPFIRMTLAPEILDMVLPFEGVAHNIAIVKTKQEFKGQGTKVMHAIWGAGQMAFNKILVIVSDNICISDYKDLCKIVIRNINIVHDVHISEGILDELDHASDDPCYGGKICFDATNDRNNFSIEINKALEWKSDLMEHIADIKDINVKLIEEDIDIAVIAVKKNKNIEDLVTQVLNRTKDIRLKIIIFIEDLVDIYNYSLLTWIASANIDPKRDCKIDSKTGILTVDATRKIFKGDTLSRDWPNVVVMDNDTIHCIDKKWKQLGIGNFMESPSLKLLKLNSNQGCMVKKQINS